MVTGRRERDAHHPMLPTGRSGVELLAGEEPAFQARRIGNSRRETKAAGWRGARPQMSDNVVGRKPQVVGEMIEGFGGAATDDRDVVTILWSRKRPHRVGRVLVCGGCELGLVAGATMDARIRREELLDAVKHRPESARRRGGI